MRLRKTLKYYDILIIAIVCIVAYKIVDNYDFFFNTIGSVISVVSPFIYAAVFAYVLNPVMKLFEKRLKMKRSIAILFTYFLIFIILGLICIYVIPSMYDSIVSLISSVPEYVDKVQDWINMMLKNDKVYDIISQTGLMDTIYGLSDKVGKILVEALQNSITSIVGIATNLIKIGFGFLISIYLLYDKEKILNGIKTLLYITMKEKRANTLIKWLRTYHDMIGRYIGIKAIDSTIIGFMALIGLAIIGAPYAIIIALVVGITNMIPYFGPLISEVVGAIFGIFVSPTMAIVILIFLLAIHQFDAWFLDPKLIGKKVGVAPYLIIIAVTIGGGFFGIIGMILASPTIATIKLCYESVIKSYLNKNDALKAAIEKNNSLVISTDKVEEHKESTFLKFKTSITKKETPKGQDVEVKHNGSEKSELSSKEEDDNI